MENRDLISLVVVQIMVLGVERGGICELQQCLMAAVDSHISTMSTSVLTHLVVFMRGPGHHNDRIETHVYSFIIYSHIL